MVRITRELVIIGVLFACGCGGKSPTAPVSGNGTPAETGSLFNGIAATTVTDTTFGAVAANPAGEKVGVVTQRNATGQIAQVTGATVVLANGSRATVFAGPDGLPARAVFGDLIAFFSDYTASSVDITVISPTAGTKTARNVALDPGALADLRQLPQLLRASAMSSVGARPMAVTGENFATALKIAGLLVSTASCVVSLSSVLASAGASLIIATGACVSAVVKVLALVNPAFDSPAITASGLLMSVATCAGGSAWGCVSTAITLLNQALSYSQGILSSSAPPTAAPSASARRFVVSASSLYLSEFSPTGTDQFIGQIARAGGIRVVAGDIAVAPDGRGYVVAFSDLYTIDTSTAVVTLIAAGTMSGVNALTSDAAGNLWGASVEDGALYRINKNNGAATAVGRFGSGWVSSGDLTFDGAGTLWGAAYRSGEQSDTLVTVDTLTGVATARGTMPRGVFGLTFVGDTLYALSSSTNRLYVVDPLRGTVNSVRSLSFSPNGTSRRR